MSLDTYRSLDAADTAAARSYLNDNFEAIFAEAVDEFTFFGQLAVVSTVLVVMGALTLWVRLRGRLPWRWAWLLALVGLTAYASLKSAVVVELIRIAPDVPQMWSLYVKSSTPLRMVRTPVSGLVTLGMVMWLTTLWRSRGRKHACPLN